MFQVGSRTFNLARKIISRKSILYLFLISVSCKPDAYQDISFYSDAFKTDRTYRIYVPPNYDADENTRYPVIYYFHGWGGRYKWDGYDLEDDIHYPQNGREEPPFVMEWKNYVKDNDVIIVTWDGYEPNLHPGKMEREGLLYGDATPYDYMRAHDKEDHHWGWDYRLYFRELVKHVDQNFRTIPDRSHRAVTGLSMGGLTAFYIAGQNKDLVSSVSAFDPADNIPLYGPKGHQAALPILEMHNSLKGLSVRLTMTDGDWLKYNDMKLKEYLTAADLSHFEFHLADYPDHWVADADKQLDFHMREFQKSNPPPDSWNHVSPAFKKFNVFDYDFSVRRERPALTIVEKTSKARLKVLSRAFLPDGPIVQNEAISISTDSIYAPNNPYTIVSYNLSDEEIKTRNIQASAGGTLTFDLPGGGHIVGINGSDIGNGPKLAMIPVHNPEYLYFEEGKHCRPTFKLVNTGNEEARTVEITASSTHPSITFVNNKTTVKDVGPGDIIEVQDPFDFMFEGVGSISGSYDSTFAGSVIFEMKVDGVVSDSNRIMFFAVPTSPYIADDDMIILDGLTIADVPVYSQGPNVVENRQLSGGRGNGNGILEKGEDVLIYIRLPKGMGPNDVNTFHRTYLINCKDDPYISVERLDYQEKTRQASATSIASVVTVSKDIPDNHELDLWFRIESLYNDPEDPYSKTTVYANKFDYRRAKVKVK